MDFHVFKDLHEIERHLRALLDWRVHIDDSLENLKTQLEQTVMPLDFTKLNAAIDAATSALATLAAAAKDATGATAQDQAALDAAAGKLKDAAAGVSAPAST